MKETECLIDSRISTRIKTMQLRRKSSRKVCDRPSAVDVAVPAADAVVQAADEVVTIIAPRVLNAQRRLNAVDEMNLQRKPVGFRCWH